MFVVASFVKSFDTIPLSELKLITFGRNIGQYQPFTPHRTVNFYNCFRCKDCSQLSVHNFRYLSYLCRGLYISWFQKYGTNFFFSVESVTLTKMDCLTIIQRIKIMKTYHKNSVFATATYRALRGDSGLHNRPTTQAIGKIV